MTLIEVLIVLAMVLILVALLLPSKSPQRVLRINCVNNLKQIGLSCRVWEGDNGDKYPWRVPETNGGTREFIAGPNAFRHLQIMSNELSTPKVAFCPEESDRDRICANTFDLRPGPDEISFVSNSNLSFFVGVESDETNPAMFLAGDHNLTNGMRLKKGILDLTTNLPAGWTKTVHRTYGNVALADGSVLEADRTNLQMLIAYSGVATNRLQMPVLER